jgi:DNA topoisomerase I
VLDFPVKAASFADPQDAADLAGLCYVSDESPGIRRRKAGSGFIYLQPNGARVSDLDVLARVKSLAVPPAWTEVWICPSKQGHIQATGRDAKGRKQYRYHTSFRELRELAKFEHMLEFADCLPRIRATLQEHMSQQG